MSKKIQSPNDKYDLVRRTSKFGEEMIMFIKSLPINDINKPLVSQLIRSATSIGANYMEADCAESNKDFRHKIGICKKESKEAMHWIHMTAVANTGRANECRRLYKEAHELTLIFSAILLPKKEK